MQNRIVLIGDSPSTTIVSRRETGSASGLLDVCWLGEGVRSDRTRGSLKDLCHRLGMGRQIGGRQRRRFGAVDVGDGVSGAAGRRLAHADGRATLKVRRAKGTPGRYCRHTCCR